jgi:hypothetical protein
MSHILRYDQFKTEYASVLSIKPEINENLQYLDIRYDDMINESFGEAMKSFWDGLTKDSEGDWSFRNIAHTIADVGGIVGDYIYPGAGTTIDIVHGLSYFIEAGFTKDETTKDECIIFGFLTLVFAFPTFNPLQGTFALIKAPFRFFYKSISKLGKTTGKLEKEVLEKEIAKILKGSKPLNNFVELLENNLKGIESFFSKEFSQPQKKGWWKKLLDWLKGTKIGKSATKFANEFIAGIKGLTDKILGPFKNWFSKKASSAGKKIDGLKASSNIGKKLTGKALSLLSPSSLSGLFKAFSDKLVNFSKSKKVKMFDDMMENLSKAQSGKGISKKLNSVVLNNKKMLVVSLSKGSDEALVIVRGKAGPGKVDKEILDYWRKQWKDNIKPTGKFTPKQRLDWIKLQCDNSLIKKIDKSEFLQKWYKGFGDKVKEFPGWQAMAGFVKFHLNVYQGWGSEKTTDTDKDEDTTIDNTQTTPEQQTEETTLSPEETQEVADKWSASIGDDPHTEAYNNLNSDERDSLAETSSQISIDSELIPPNFDINFVVWKILSQKYSLDMPDNPKNKPFGKDLSKYQTDKNLSNTSGELDKSTVESLYNDTDESAFKSYLLAYSQIIFDQESEKKELPDEESKEETEKKPKKGERIKRFGKWLAGTSKEE